MKLSGIFPLALSSVFPASAMAEPSSLEPMTILATRSEKGVLDTPGSDAVLTDEDLSRQGSSTLGSALKYIPGVSVPFDFSGSDALVPYLGGGEKSVNIRGMEGNRISISVDGIRQPQGFLVAGGMAGPGRVYFDPATLSQLELYKSASSSLYGNESMGGSVNGRTVSPEVLLGKELMGSAGSNELTYATVNRSIGNRLAGGHGNGIWAVSAVYSYREGHERINNSSIPSDPQEFDSNALVFKTFRKGALFDWEGTVDLYDQSTFTDVNSIEGNFTPYVGHQANRDRQRFSFEAMLSDEKDLGFADELSILLYAQESEQKSINSQDRLNDNNESENRLRNISFQTDLSGINLQLAKLIELQGSSHQIRGGIEYSDSKILTNYLQWDTSDDPNDPNLENKNTMAPSDAREFGIYLQDEIEIESLAGWVVTPSMRIDKYEVTPKIDQAFLDNPSRMRFRFNPVHYENDPVISPGLSILRRMDSGNNFYFTYNRGIRNPSAEELNGFFEHPPTSDRLVLIRPNPKLQEETSDSFEIGAQARLDQGSLSFAFFKNFYDDFIKLEEETDPNFDVYTNQNVGKVRIHGFEFSFERKLGNWINSLDGFGAGLSTSWSRGQNVDDSQPLDTIEPWQAIFFIDYESEENWGMRVTGTHRSAKKVEDLDLTKGDSPIAGSLVIDWLGWIRLNQTFRVQAGLNNLTDEKYFLWSSARRGGFHGVTNSTAERNRQPGINGFLSLRASF